MRFFEPGVRHNTTVEEHAPLFGTEVFEQESWRARNCVQDSQTAEMVRLRSSSQSGKPWRDTRPWLGVEGVAKSVTIFKPEIYPSA